MSKGPVRGDDCLTTFLSGIVGIIVIGALAIILLSWIFNR